MTVVFVGSFPARVMSVYNPDKIVHCAEFNISVYEAKLNYETDCLSSHRKILQFLCKLIWFQIILL